MKRISLNTLGNRKYRRAALIMLLAVFWIYNAPFESFTSQPFQRYTASRMAFTSCSIQINNAVTFCDSSIDSAKCFCSNKVALATLTHCYKIGHPQQMHSLLTYCESNGINLSWHDLHLAEETYESSAQYPSNIIGFNRSTPTSVPIRLNETEIYDYGNSTSAFLGIYDKSSRYLLILLSYWIVIFVIACARHWCKHFFPGMVKHLTGKFNNIFRKYIDLPATFGQRKTKELSLWKFPLMLIPSRADTLIILVFVGMLVFFVNYDTQGYSRDVIFKSQEIFGKRTSAVRTSAILSYLLPLLVLFAGRVNTLQWLIGWDYATFITYHRWISRIVVILSLLHAVNYRDYLLMEGFWDSERIKFYMVCGIHAYHAGILTLIQGLLCLRRSWYEVFLVLHILLAGIFIVGGLYHARSIAYVWFYYFSVALWVSDRIVRIFLLFEFGFPRAKIALIADECLKITIPRPDHWEAIPGGHVFIQFLLLPIYFWQSHPFTYVTALKEIIIYCKVKDGVTRTIASELRQIPDRTGNYFVGVEGSYGEPTPATNYDSLIFVAGGNGIPGIYAEAMHATERLKYGQFVKLIWVIREFKSIEWFENELQKLGDTKIETSVYITSGKYAFNEPEIVGYGSTHHKMYRSVQSLQTAFPHIEFIIGRPIINSIVQEETQRSNGSTAFISCGHPHMVDEVRASVVKNIGSKRVDYFEQLQVWA